MVVDQSHEYITLGQAAEMVGVSSRQAFLYRAATRGVALQLYRFGVRSIFLKRADLEADLSRLMSSNRAERKKAA